MTVIRKTTMTTIVVSGGITAIELREALDGVPADARLSFDYYKGDQRDPSYVTIKATWNLS